MLFASPITSWCKCQMKWAQTILDSFICPIYSVNLSSDEEFTGAGVVLVGNDGINSCFHYDSAR